MSLLEKCTCGETQHERSIINGVDIMTCSACGLQRQYLEMSENELWKFYNEDYQTKFQNRKGTITYQDRYKHDYKISSMREIKYSPHIQKSLPVIDIGSSNNAFVDYMRGMDYPAYGVEIAKEAETLEYTYNQELFDIHFPTQYAGTITLHDVIEHVPDPIKYLRECNRILKNDGILIIDLPHYHVPEGQHHWKKIEHLWYWTEQQMVDEVVRCGFELSHFEYPIPGKVVFYFKRIDIRKNPKKLITMPGMGDNYWILVKLQSIIEREGWDMPDLYAWDQNPKHTHIHGKQRSEDFLTKVPFINYCGGVDLPDINRIFKEFYTIQAPSKKPHSNKLTTMIPNIGDYDYVLNFNGVLEDGKSLNSWGLEKYETNWNIPIFISWEEMQLEKNYREQYGDFNVGYFNDHGFYKKHMCPFLTPEKLADMFTRVYNETGRKTILIGAQWDQPYQRRIHELAKESTIDLTMQTSVSQMFSLFRASKMVVGWASGSTIMAAVFGKPSVMYWSQAQWPHIEFMYNALDPKFNGVTYFPYDMEVVKNDVPAHVEEVVEKAKKV